ncbi:hypothetical protein PybrP1_005787 [[Pythium] brassicae (nom. inval.)]|nr:hypothetical protein PybrP1_005787 [[Pythium] brassicae (nom. inval.)]
MGGTIPTRLLLVAGAVALALARGVGGVDLGAVSTSPSPVPVPVPASARYALPRPDEAAFATFFYDHGADSDALFLATRVLMRSIRESGTVFRKILLVPRDGIARAKADVLLADDPSIELVRTSAANVFLHTSVTDHRAQLLHMRNKLVVWDDPALAALKRVAYLDPENLVLRNLDEIFACGMFCAVDNGQAVVYSNSLLVISPDSVAARNLYSDAIDSFMISGRAYNYVGITQGFLPGLFEAFEESPLFHFDDDDDGGDMANGEPATKKPAPPPATPDSVVHRLPFYYSINHMVFYERMNWDLYKCKDKNHTAASIPGPLLSYKYSGATVKPWFWLPYTYFQVFWHWQDVRERLNEDHVGFFASKVVSLSVIFAFAWVAYVALCLRLHSEPNGRPRRLSSWGLPAPGNAQPITMDLFNSKAMRKACQISCSILYGVSSTPLLSSFALTLGIMWVSIFSVPGLMHPRYACKLWLYLHNLLTLTALLVFDVAHTFRAMPWKRGEVPATTVLLFESLASCAKRLPAIVVGQLLFLYVVGRTDLFMNPVLRPIVTFGLLTAVGFVHMRVLSTEMARVARK